MCSAKIQKKKDDRLPTPVSNEESSAPKPDAHFDTRNVAVLKV